MESNKISFSAFTKNFILEYQHKIVWQPDGEFSDQMQFDCIVPYFQNYDCIVNKNNAHNLLLLLSRNIRCPLRCDQAVIVSGILYEYKYNRKIFNSENIKYFCEHPLLECSNDISVNIRLLGLGEKQSRKIVSITSENNNLDLSVGNFIAIGGCCHICVVVSIQPLMVMELWGQERLLRSSGINVIYHLHQINLGNILSFFLSNDLLICNAFSKSYSKLLSYYSQDYYHINQIKKIYDDLDSKDILHALNEGEENASIRFNATIIAKDIINKGYLIIEY